MAEQQNTPPRPMKNFRRLQLEVSIGDKEDKPTLADVVFCESSASLQFNNMTVHIPWSELAQWQAWLANRVEEEA